MNKLLTKIVGATLGLAMAIGVGVGVANNKKATELNAVTTYEQLTSISGIDETASYVLGIDGTGFHYEGTSSWGKTALPTEHTPLYYTLKKAANGQSFTASTTISSTKYYLQVPTSNTFSMATSTGTNTDLIIGTTQISGTNYAVANKDTTTRHLRRNGTSGLRSYAGATGAMAFFYKVVVSSEPATYTVTYDANGGTGTMTDSNSPYTDGSPVTVLDNSFTRSGYEFVKFNTAADGSGQDYTSGEAFNIAENTTLYAQWSVIKYPCTDENNQITWDLSVASYDTMTAEEATWTSGKASVTVAKGSSSTNVNNVVPPEESHTRFYKNSVMTISPASGYKVDSIVFTAPDDSYANILNNSTWTNASSSVDSTDVTVVPTIKVDDVVVTIANATRLTQSVVNYSVYSPLRAMLSSGL